MAEANEQQSAVPPGYRRDAMGRLVPEELIGEVDKLRDALVLELAAMALEMSERLAEFKQRAFGDIQSFVDLSAEKYNVKRRGTKGNITLTSFDGSWRIVYSSHQRITFDERLQAAKAKIDECILDWSRNSSPEARALIQDAFRTDDEGRLQTGRILQLRRLQIDDPRWQEAMKAIGESVQVVGSTSYVRFYRRRGLSDQYDAVSLDIAAL